MKKIVLDRCCYCKKLFSKVRIQYDATPNGDDRYFCPHCNWEEPWTGSVTLEIPDNIEVTNENCAEIYDEYFNKEM